MSSRLGLILLVLASGCMQALEDQVKKDPNNIVGKKTQDIGEFDPNAGAAVSDSKVEVTNPITGPLEAYGPMVERISKTHVEHALNLFNATEGRYPESYDEFMEKIIKANNIQLPVLPGGKKYQYDVPNHQLVVVDAPVEPAP
ncbi:hypothetical protein GC163_00270 [bacterium]|nr:hypothetical protein [bacterium]